MHTPYRMLLLDAPLMQGWLAPTKQVSILYLFWLSCLDLWKFKTEPRIQDVKTNSGQILWRVFDARCDYIFWFDSEKQVLAWLERRHPRKN